MLPDQTTILIVGAGPTGLAAAAALIHHGCRDIVIVDAVERDNRPQSSRALVIHAATLEALESIGCAEPLINIGIKAKEIRISNEDGPLMNTDFSGLTGHTSYPYSLLVSQYSTERILENKLEEMGVKVHRPFKLVGLDDGGERGLVATFESGQSIKANYVLGADGTRSAVSDIGFNPIPCMDSNDGQVRQLAKVGYADPDGEIIDEDKQIQMVMADVTFKPSPPLTRDEIHGFSSSDNFFMSIPVPRSPWPESYDHLDDNIFRIGFSVPKDLGPPPHSPPLEFFQQGMDKLRPKFLYNEDSPDGVKIDKLLWTTRFRIHAAIADKFLVRFHSSDQKNACRIVFLVGDAAHIHSPIGGQGMNLGLRDAIGLAPVLAKHVESFTQDGKAADKELEEYADVRRTRAVNTIALTKRGMSSISFIGSTGWSKYLVWVVKLIVGIPFVRENMLYQVSGLGNR